jgi:hypothetical protein
MPTLQFTERALIARERPTGKSRVALERALSQLAATGRISSEKPLSIKVDSTIWAARVDGDLRLLFTKTGDEIVVLDIVRHSEYSRYLP